MKKTESHLKTTEHILQGIENMAKKNLENQHKVTSKPVLLWFLLYQEISRNNERHFRLDISVIIKDRCPSTISVHNHRFYCTFSLNSA